MSISTSAGASYTNSHSLASVAGTHSTHWCSLLPRGTKRVTQRVFFHHHHTSRENNNNKKNARTVNKTMWLGCGVVAARLHTSGLCRPDDTTDCSSKTSPGSRTVTRARERERESLVARETKRGDGSGASAPTALAPPVFSLLVLLNRQQTHAGTFFFRRSGGGLVPSKQTVASPGFQGD